MNHSPTVTLLVAAYNEAEIIAEKAENCLQLLYPPDRLQLVFVTDGSTDGTPERLLAFPQIRVYHELARNGKLNAVQRVMPFVTSDIVVLTDANAMINPEALQKIVRHYEDEGVGAVAGEKKIRKSAAGEAATEGEGLYWKYESWLKKTDSDLHSVVGAAGELFSFRRALYEELPADTIIEDFVLSMRIAMKGYRVIYEPGAVASESGSATLREEWKRKVRICAGAFQSFGRLAPVFNPFVHGWLTIQFLSHRFLRWAVVPFLFPMLIAATLVLALDRPEFRLLAGVEVLGLLAAAGGWWAGQNRRLPKLVMLPTYLLMMNAAAYAGLYRFLTARQSAVWEKAKRAGA